jgi:hypothetical protein
LCVGSTNVVSVLDLCKVAQMYLVNPEILK